MRTFAIATLAGIAGTICTLMWVESLGSSASSASAQTSGSALDSTKPTPRMPKIVAPPASAPIFVVSPQEKINRTVYDACNRGVVNISVTTYRRTFFGAVPESGDSGSGAVIDQEGHILTNYHVVEGARRISVTLANGDEYDGEVIGLDPLNDIAVLKIKAPAEDLNVIPLGDSSSLFVGQAIYAIGNPFGLQRTLSTGIIASLGRSLNVRDDWVIKSVIQIDAAINPGNSGGPLLDSAGRLIGINTAIAARAQQSAGIGFAIPVDLVKRSIPDLIEHGRIVRGDLGITVSEGRQGLQIVRIEPDGPADVAGLQGPLVKERREGGILYRRIDRGAADIIVALNGEQITTAAEFFAQIGARKPGETVELTIIRDSKLVNVNVTLGDEYASR